VHYAWLGVSTQTLTPSLAERFDFPVERGAAIQNVIDNSPAKAAGLRGGGDEQEFAGISIAPGGDVIVAIDGEAVQTAEDVVRAITDREPGQRARFTIQRGAKRLVVDVVLGERPANPPENGR
jgi:S1-C subfamily serine protease